MSLTTIGSTIGGAVGLTGNAAGLLGTLSSLADGSWLSELLPCTYRGIPIAIRATDGQSGRRTAVHRYPYRDEVWAEDTGRAERVFDVTGFLIGDNCASQASALRAATEQPGTATLVHPYLGVRQVAMVEPMRDGTRLEQGRVIEIRLRLIESTDPTYPSSAQDTQGASLLSGISTFLTSASAFTSKVAGYVSLGSAVFGAGVRTLSLFTERADNLMGSARLLNSAVAGLPPPPGLFYGRYANGARSDLLADATTPQQAIANVAAARLYAGQLGDAVLADGGTYAATVTDLPPALRLYIDAVGATCADPADAVQIFVDLATFAPAGTVAGATLGLQDATSALCRQAALYGLAQACAAYRPTSSDDARAVLATVLPAYDAEILSAADAGHGDEYLALRMLRTAVAADLAARGTQLPDLIKVVTAEPQPALTLAYRLYGDASRADDLTARSDAVASMFLPTRFEALSA